MLKDRSPLAIYCNPVTSFPLEDFSGVNGQLSYAAKVAAGAAKYYHMVVE